MAYFSMLVHTLSIVSPKTWLSSDLEGLTSQFRALCHVSYLILAVGDCNFANIGFTVSFSEHL